MVVMGKNNTYQVIDKCASEDGSQSWFKVKCVDFYETDNLGDNILCENLNQEIWIANFHFRKMHVLEIQK